MSSVTTIRAVVLRTIASSVELHIEDENVTIRLLADMKTAREVGALLSSEIDAEVEIKRGADGLIESGELLSFVKVGRAAHPMALWRKWFREAHPRSVLGPHDEPERD